MSRAIHVGVVALVGFIFDVGGVDGNTARFFFRRRVDLVIARIFRLAGLGEHLGDRRRQGRLAMIDMANRPDIAMRLIPFEFSLVMMIAPA